MVYQTNVKNLMDRKETQCKCIERGECSKITVENNKEEANGIFRNVCRRRGLEFLSLTGKVEGKTR